jgi:lipid II:glycine glycyltransferase (peptidoglycan interpeptide bridge formation enzyme)
MTIQESTNQEQWDQFLTNQLWSPFLQSWTMGEVYRDIGQEPVRLEIREENIIVGICQAITVPARRGKHLMVQYGPVGEQLAESGERLVSLLEELKRMAKEKGCSFVRISPFWEKDMRHGILDSRTLLSPLHLLAEHIWYINLKGKTTEDILKNMRKNHRNLIRRAQREGVIVTASDDPIRDLPLFLQLHEETRRRHKFTPYTDDFFRAQIQRFGNRVRESGSHNHASSLHIGIEHRIPNTEYPPSCTLYIARYNSEPIASSIHMHFGGETSYHHGASTHKYPKVPASYLLQWTAICDAIQRKDRIYNFWGVAPTAASGERLAVNKHPFAGVTTFKTGFGGQLQELMHCRDIPVSPKYYLTYAFEHIRKWKRGF